MSEVQVEATPSTAELLATGRRSLVTKDYSGATEALARACEALDKEHGSNSDQCAEAYLWYGKALLGLSREERDLFGDGVPGADQEAVEDSNEEDEEENGEEDQNGEAVEENGKAEENGEGVAAENGEAAPKENGDTEKPEEAKADEPSSSKPQDNQEPGTSNGDESVADLENEEVENLQLAWEMLDLSRNLLEKRVSSSTDAGETAASRALLADVYLTLGEVALESGTYDKAVADMQTCLDMQKELYPSDDRFIAETHYQIALAHSLASNFDDAVTHFKNAANIIESRIKTLENPDLVSQDASGKKYSSANAKINVEEEIKDLKELLPEVKLKIQDMVDYKTETKERVRDALCTTNGAGASSSSSSAFSNGAGSSSAAQGKPATNISHLVKRKRKASETEDATAAKRPNT